MHASADPQRRTPIDARPDVEWAAAVEQAADLLDHQDEGAAAQLEQLEGGRRAAVLAAMCDMAGRLPRRRAHLHRLLEQWAPAGTEHPDVRCRVQHELARIWHAVLNPPEAEAVTAMFDAVNDDVCAYATEQLVRQSFYGVPIDGAQLVAAVLALGERARQLDPAARQTAVGLFGDPHNQLPPGATLAAAAAL